jgi:hypothetical protein
VEEMKEIRISKSENTGLWDIFIDGEIEYECLSNAELIEVVKDLMI